MECNRFDFDWRTNFDLVDQTDYKKASFLDRLFLFDGHSLCCFPLPALFTDFKNSGTRELYGSSQSYKIECDRKHFDIGFKWNRILRRMDIQSNLFKTNSGGCKRQEVGRTIGRV